MKKLPNTTDNIIDAAERLAAAGCPCSINNGEHPGVLLSAETAVWLAEVLVMARKSVRELCQERNVCYRCGGDGKAHGSDRPFEWHGDGTYPGPCPVCNGSGLRNIGSE